jgi:hypothetical protein
MSCVGTLGAAMIGVWRGVLYRFPTGVWTLEIAALLVGLAAGTTRLRFRYEWLFLVAIVLTEAARRPLELPPELTAALFLFGAGWGATRTLSDASTSARRRRRVLDALRAGSGFSDPAVRPYLERHFAVAPVLHQRAAAAGKLLRGARRALRHDSRLAASELRAFAAALDALFAECDAVPDPPALAWLAQANNDAGLVRISEAAARAAEELERGCSVDLGARLRPLQRDATSASRDWLFALRVLARHHGVQLPRWFCKLECRLAQTRV